MRNRSFINIVMSIPYRRRLRTHWFVVDLTSWPEGFSDNSSVSWSNTTCTPTAVNHLPGIPAPQWPTTCDRVCVIPRPAKGRTAPSVFGRQGRLRHRRFRQARATGQTPWWVDSADCTVWARTVRSVRTLRIGWCSTDDRSWTWAFRCRRSLWKMPR